MSPEERAQGRSVDCTGPSAMKCHGTDEACVPDWPALGLTVSVMLDSCAT